MARRTFQYSLATLLILSLLCGAGMTWWFGRHARWAARLADPAQRDEALFNLLHNQKSRDPETYEETKPDNLADCQVNHVVVCPQTDGSKVYLVFKRSTYNEPKTGPGKARGHCMLFDSQGYMIPWIHAANSFDGELIERPVEDGPMLCVDTIPFSSATAVYVTEISQRHRQPLLYVAMERGEYASTATLPNGFSMWWWRVDRSKGGFAIEVGPQVDPRVDEDHPAITPAARYEWSRERREFVGPLGGPKENFMRLNPSTLSKDLKQFAKSSTDNMKSTGAKKNDDSDAKYDPDRL